MEIKDTDALREVKFNFLMEYTFLSTSNGIVPVIAVAHATQAWDAICKEMKQSED